MEKNKLKDIIGYEPSEYQVKIFDYLTESSGNLVVSAKAGSGKTSTMLSSLSLLPVHSRKLFLAFNKSIVSEISDRLEREEIEGVDVQTTHSKGFELLRTVIAPRRKFNLQNGKYYVILRQQLEQDYGISRRLPAKEMMSEQKRILSNCLDLITEARQYLRDKEYYINRLEKRLKELEETEKEITENKKLKKKEKNLALGEIGNLRTYLGGKRKIYDTVFKCLDYSKLCVLNPVSGEVTIDYLDMLWLPAILDFEIPESKKYDIVFIDEVQDITYATLVLFQKFIATGGRFVAVGDERQRINGFAGSYPDVFPELLSRPGTKLLKLPVSFRCPKSVVRLAKRIVSGIKSAPGAKEGKIYENTRLEDLPQGCMLLSRQASCLLAYYFYLVSLGRRCCIKGIDIMKKIESVLDPVRGEDVDGLTDFLLYRLFTERDNEFEELRKERGNKNLSYTSWINTYSCSTKFTSDLEIIMSVNEIVKSGLYSSVDSIIQALHVMFSDSSYDDRICLSTIHKAKGLESEVVCVSKQNFPNPYFLDIAKKRGPEAEKEFKRDEDNLMYVAVTRSKSELHFLDFSRFVDQRGKLIDTGSSSMRNYVTELEEKCGYIVVRNKKLKEYGETEKDDSLDYDEDFVYID